MSDHIPSLAGLAIVLAAVAAMVAFAIVLVLTIVQMLVARYWVTYG